mmetsp:Transcript_2904/g.7368  ORF Transcript_2904/g.7368 Transcript_2904/m.7368 type:complete len:237 (+) Transcript_2904:1225-1935(+)
MAVLSDCFSRFHPTFSTRLSNFVLEQSHGQRLQGLSSSAGPPLQFPRGPPVHDHDTPRHNDAAAGQQRPDPKRRLDSSPAGIRHLRADDVVPDAPQPANRQPYPHRERNLPALEPLRRDGGLRHAQRLRAEAEHEPAEVHGSPGFIRNAQGEEDGSREYRGRECRQAERCPVTVHDVSPEQRQYDVGYRVHGVQEIELRLEVRGWGHVVLKLLVQRGWNIIRVVKSRHHDAHQPQN